MPVITVKSLPFAHDFYPNDAVKKISSEFSIHNEIAEEHITVIWQFLDPEAYIVGGRAAQHQPEDSHPIQVDLLAPDFNSSHTIHHMLTTLAAVVAEVSGMPLKNIFINCRLAVSGQVFDCGKLVQW